MKQTERITHLSRVFVPDPNIDVGLCGESMNLKEKCLNFSRCFHSRYSAENYEASGSDIGGSLGFFLLPMNQTSGGLLPRLSITFVSLRSSTLILCVQHHQRILEFAIFLEIFRDMISIVSIVFV